MNQAQRDALGSAIVNAKDDLYRAQRQKRLAPGWKSGNGETMDEVIAGYQRQVNELTEALEAEAHS